ncbi:MAG: TlpA-like protein disulfide reductase [Gammaproteobacteria bacterium]|jgi:thiol-disulfide isomerase/thioredoxin|nr:TlpA-like protein disulfide reductase [Gammaproteobacteria bacterium]
MRTFSAVLLLMALSISGVPAAGPPAMPLHDTPRPVPEIAFTDGEGEPRTLDAWRGKIVLLNIWATWCGPCRAEMPTLDRLQARLGSDRFEVIALSIDRAGVGVVAEFFEEIGIEHLRIFIDESGGAARDLKVFGLPATLLIGRDGRELGRLVGPAEWDTPEMTAFLETLIANQQERN